MDYKEIQNLIKLAGSSNISELKLKNGDFELTIRTKDYQKVSYSASPQPTVYNVPGQMLVPQANDHIAYQTNDLIQEDNQTSTAQAAHDVRSGLVEVRSPIVGTFYRSASPDKEPYVKIGDRINQKTVVCIVEAMKLFNEIESDVSGKVVDILVEDGSPVEYDQLLFMIDPKG